MSSRCDHFQGDRLRPLRLLANPSGRAGTPLPAVQNATPPPRRRRAGGCAPSLPSLAAFWRALALVLFSLAISAPAAEELSTNGPVPITARDCFNTGTRLLAARKLADAEKMFQAALAAQNDELQPRALYNLGHTRFASGLERLKQGPDAQKALARGDAALAASDAAIHQSESALAQRQLDQMISAYIEGRGVRHELREAEKAVSAAMETYGKTLEQWLRAADDFKGAAELHPADTNAAYNAQIVERGIAKLVDSVRKMQEMMGMMGQKKQELGKVLSKLKGNIPAQDAPPGPAGEDDEDDQGMKPADLADKKENAAKPGEQMQTPLSPDQASQMLSGLSLDGTKRLEMSDKEGKPPKDRKGRNW